MSTSKKQPPENPVWHEGPPPSIGWWPASFHRNPISLRWWNGKRWSYTAKTSHSARHAAKLAGCKRPAGGEWFRIEWTQPWW